MDKIRFLVHRGWLTLAVVCAVMAFAAPAAFAATFTVNTPADTSDAGGCTTATVCSLRDAVAAANATSGSTISLPAGHYTLNTGSSPLGQLDITAATTIVGQAARTTIVDGNGMSRVFDFEPSDVTAVLELENITVTGGSAPATALTITDPGDGAGIFSLGGLDLEHVAVIDNTAALGGGGVMDGTIHNETAPGPATFNGVTIADNHVVGGAGNGQGGGAVVATTLTMTNSTVADNSTANAGINEGGGIVNALNDPGSAVSATLVNDTITGNTAAEPIASPVGDMGGGISGDQLAADGPYDTVVDATNTIVAGNTADGAEQDCALIDTADGTSSHNIEGDTTCGFSDSASKQTTAVELGTLRDNGGPTDTLLPSATSPAVDKGTNTGCPATDERGVTRPQGSACDIGAVELAPPSAVTGAASAIGVSGATVSGTASNPAVVTGTVVFDYGTTTAYGKTASAGTLAVGSVNAAHSAALAGLTPGTIYHYRISVTTTDGTATGLDATFRTALTPTSTTVVCSPSSLIVNSRTLCTATVADGTSAAPTGTVKFTSQSPGSAFTGSGLCKLSAKPASGSSTCSVTYTATGKPGARTIDAGYAGDAQHAPSNASRSITVRQPACGPATGSLSGDRLGPVKLGDTRAEIRKLFLSYSDRGRRTMDFFCLAGGRGIRVGYLGGRAVLALTSNTHYHLGQVRPGDSLAKAERTLHIWTHFRVGLNKWYFATGTASSGVLKVRHGQVQEIGIAAKSRTRTRAGAFRLLTSLP
jgi:CSLREA domain-containing protein